MARMTKSYADRQQDIDEKIAKLNAQKDELDAKAAEYYPKAGDLIFKALEASNLKEVKTKWNDRVSNEFKIDKIECDAVEPKLDTTLIMTDRKKFDKLLEEYMSVVDKQKAAAGEAISDVLHVSVQGDLKNALIDLGILEGTKTSEPQKADEPEEVIEESEEIVDDFKFDDADDTDDSTYDPYA